MIVLQVVCTTVYIKKDIPALKMSDGKLWFKEKTYRNFAKYTCHMKTSEIDETIQTCKEAVYKASKSLDVYAQNNREIKSFANQLKEEFEKGVASFN